MWIIKSKWLKKGKRKCVPTYWPKYSTKMLVLDVGDISFLMPLVNTIAMTKPEKAQAVENMLINMAHTGRIGSKLNEDQLKQLLLQISSASQKPTVVKFDRRRAAMDSDDDL
ncbi:Programmed cell death protein 5 [Fasciola gigantica]|uniref:Programmed cell death protein 5 n=1 Tax=Fasciola gigantica TaxID=46835 RepID=A0A504YN39_FASGI|nr:Programmed cell death protein 5 [Fasciola gigantica]